MSDKIEASRERRQHRRLPIRLPLECSICEEGHKRTLRAVTANIGPGGVYFEADVEGASMNVSPDTLWNLELTVPPGEGHFPYEGRIESVVRVLRCERVPPLLQHDANLGGTNLKQDTKSLGQTGAAMWRRERMGIAVEFRKPVRLAF